MQVEKLDEIFSKRLIDGKLPCSAAFEISKEFNIPLNDIGKYANEKNIKIKNCQLGCF